MHEGEHADMHVLPIDVLGVKEKGVCACFKRWRQAIRPKLDQFVVNLIGLLYKPNKRKSSHHAASASDSYMMSGISVITAVISSRAAWKARTQAGSNCVPAFSRR